MLTSWLSRIEKVHRAYTQKERQAVYRLRYRTYVEEMKHAPASADHERKMMYDDDDERGEKVILYTGSLDNITGSVSARTWDPGRVPEEFAKALSLQLFPGIEALRVAEIERFVIRPDARGKLMLPALIRRIYEILVGEYDMDLAFVICFPGLVRHYRKIGLVPYAASLVEAYGFTFVPMVIVGSDYASMRRVGSFLAPVARRYYGPGRRPVLDTRPFRHLLQDKVAPIDLDPARVWTEVQSALVTPHAASPFLGSLPPQVLERLTRSGFLMKLRAGATLIREGIKDAEVFVILDGLFEVLEGEKRVSLQERGDVVGEVAFFTGSGLRTATVRALTDGRVLVLRRKFLQELTREDPEAGYQLLMGLGRVMAERIAEMTNRVESHEE